MVQALLNESIALELRAIQTDPLLPLASLAAIVVRGGEVVLESYHGRRFIDDANPFRDRPVNADTLFRIASISKLICAIAALRLVENGCLDLDVDASDYLGFTLRNLNFADRPITTRMLLSHTSSLRDDAGYYFDSKSGRTLRDLLAPPGQGLRKGEMWATNAPPGDYFQYANLPWGVLGTIMECVSGERFDALMKRLVFDPMELSGGFSPADFPHEQLENVATLYRKRTGDEGKEIWNTGGPWIPQVDDFVNVPPKSRIPDDYLIGSNATLAGPQGNCRLSARGLARVMLMLMNDGRSDDSQILRPESVRAMFSQQWRADGKESNGNTGGEDTCAPTRAMNAWGLGVQHILDLSGPACGDRLVEPGGYLASGHFGDAYGLTSALMFDRSTRSGLIYLVGGVGAAPTSFPGKYSSLFRYEERILTALYRCLK